MKIAKYVLPVIAAGFAAQSAMAGMSFAPVDDGGVLPAGTVSNAINWDGGGTLDWQGSALYISLTSGTVYDNAGQTAVNSSFWGLVPELEFETWVGPVGPTINVVGGAGDIGGPGGSSPVLGPNELSITWADTPSDDTGFIQIASVALSDDANGTAKIRTIFTGGGSTTLTLPVVNGIITPEPASFALLGLGGLAFLRRR